MGSNSADVPRVDIRAPGKLYCPLATQYMPPMTTRGDFRKGHPEGLVVHFTAGWDRDEEDARSTIAYGVSQGYAYWVISPGGRIYQTHPLNRWGYHAGKSTWPSLGSGVSQFLLGVEICCGGMLTPKGKSWFGKQYNDLEIREIKTTDHNRQAGKYAMFSQAQEASLELLCLWLHYNRPDVFKLDLILGHDETSPGRKNDPGGSLSMNMPEFRSYLKNKAALTVGLT
jgi:N-acetyl-anhydromuramyl-L-alanine amidase AmpD